jgi:uncharacterized protein (DUF305 family)
MVRSTSTQLLPALLSVALLAGCAGGTSEPGAVTPAPSAAAGPPMAPYTDADVEFMTGMIGHHAQATLIAGWAESHGASPELQRLAARIVVGQDDEIAIMQRWLRQRGETVPDPDSSHSMHGHGAHHAQMPGMLTADELAALDAARGTDFDRLFLTLMIRHHEGAIQMVDRLFGSQGAAQDDVVFRLASDVQADQIAEIRRMRIMLDALPPSSD